MSPVDVLLLAGWLTAIYATITHWRTPDGDTSWRDSARRSPGPDATIPLGVYAALLTVFGAAAMLLTRRQP